MGSVGDLLLSLERLDAGSLNGETERLQIRDALQKALRKIDKPDDIVQEHVNWYLTEISVVKSLIFAGVFGKWAEDGSEALSCTELARMTGADAVLLRRLMRAAASVYLFDEVDYDTYSRSAWAVKMGEEPFYATRYELGFTQLNLPSTNALPYFLRDTSFKNPTNVDHSAFQYAHGEGMGFFDYIASDPGIKAMFHNTMARLNQFASVPWTTIYPVNTLTAGVKHDRPILVDVGGSKGHDVKHFLSAWPAAPPGSAVVQDRAEVFKLIDDPVLLQENGQVTLMPHDFFTEQPLKGARAYFLHRILHDWPDEKAEQILRHLVGALEREYSKVLIYEIVLGDRNPGRPPTFADISMMRQFASQERSETEWCELLGSVGLRLVKIWGQPRAFERLIEAELM